MRNGIRSYLLPGLVWLVAGLCAAMAMAVGWWLSRMPALPPVPEKTTAPFVWPVVETPPAEIWSVFQPVRSQTKAPEGSWARRFRLAGTFFEFVESGGQNESSASRAILDDLEARRQHLVREGETVEGAVVKRIFKDHVVLRAGDREETLWLSFLSARDGVPPSGAPSGPADRDGPALETSRFGKRVGETRWVFRRDALMDYYRELMDNPERLASVFLSLKPDYNAENRIAGYVLDVEGEGAFFKDVGMLPGDRVRKVNSMNMTSQARAEYFIGEFVKNRLNAVVIDIERDGQPRKLIYMLR